ncbi:MAG: 30S ribosomal protein S3ae [Candidatus Thermoplasmatota archaeon]|jgi:small subunit ribosomal protein S3Ae|nr:30S ribosomal protein S3ae [Candidatus Thermoplasmatota archaeon]MCL5800911.1 30S ribosomal protein S3ae [Candidatus Thermoplasmatota archaeon]
MASEKSQKKGKDKWKEKTWFTIAAPPFMGGKEIVKCPGASPEVMVGRRVEVPVSDLTGNVKKGNTKAIFKIVSCNGLECQTTFDGHYVGDDYIRRLVRRRKDRIDIIVKDATKDGYGFVIKAVIVIDGKLNASKLASIRKGSDEFLRNKIRSLSLGELSNYVIGDEITSDLISVSRHIFPLRKVEIRKTENHGPIAQVAETRQDIEEPQAPA